MTNSRSNSALRTRDRRCIGKGKHSGNEPASRSPLLIDFLPLVLMWRTLSSVLIYRFPAS